MRVARRQSRSGEQCAGAEHEHDVEVERGGHCESAEVQRGLHDGRLPEDSELARSTRPAELRSSGYAPFPESTAFRELQ